MKKIFIVFKVLIYMPLILLLIIIRPVIFIKFYIISLDRIGNIVHPDMFLINKKKNFLSILLINSKKNNSALIQILKKRIKLLFITNTFPQVLHILSKRFEFIKKHIYKKNNFQSFDFINKKRNFYLTKEQIYLGEKIFRDNIGKKLLEKKIICFTTRDNEYLKKKLPNRNFEYHNYRDMNADKIIPAIKYLIKKGFFVIRMGRVAQKKINFKNQFFLDYPFSNYKCDLLDVYIAEKAYNWFGSNCGLDLLRWIFRKPVAIFNMAPLALMPFNHKNIVVIPKKYKKNNKYLKLSEIFELSVAAASGQKEFLTKKIQLIENSSKEILNLVKFVLNFQKTFKLQKNQKKTIQIFCKEFIKNLKKYKLENYQVKGCKNLRKNISIINPDFLRQSFKYV